MAGTRRDFLKSKLVAGASLAFLPTTTLKSHSHSEKITPPPEEWIPDPAKALDLSPAQWIWLEAGRTLPNTVLFFRRSFTLDTVPKEAKGHIMADSRYRLWVNGKRIQFGPAPSDPRWAEADPIDLAPFLREGENVVGVEILYYGLGEGTWPLGKPGLLFRATVGEKEILSNRSWQVQIAHAWPPGQYKRSYLRSFQEVFDARKYPYGWNAPGFRAAGWLTPAIIEGSSPKRPSISSASRDYLYDAGGEVPTAQLRQRSVPLMLEELRPIDRLREAYLLTWRIDPEDFFRFDLVEDSCFQADSLALEPLSVDEGWELNMQTDQAIALTFTLHNQCVGFPYFTIEAPEGTIVELLVHEGHTIGGTHRLLNTHFHSWSRFICTEGVNTFETFDYESVMWLQLHIRNTQGQIKIRDVGVRRRYLPFPHTPTLSCGDEKMEKLFDACVNTMFNQSQETIVDGMARERQQYSGDIGHVLHPLLAGFKGKALAARFCNTFSQGLTKAGYFLDCWPAADRLTRIMEREIGITEWGPLLDHSVGFVFDCYHYYMYTGDYRQLEEVYPRLKRFYTYLIGIRGEDGLVPVEDLGIPVVWIDHLAFQQQRHKLCAFNLYIAAMLQHALPTLAVAFGENELGREAERNGKKIQAAVIRNFYSPREEGFICNLPWIKEEKSPLYDDRSMATAILFDLFPESIPISAYDILAQTPSNLGMSYATNAIWRYWALAKGGRIDILLDEFRGKWMDMPSVQANNTMGEWFILKPDTRTQWSHAAVSPMICLYTSIMGVKPLTPGFTEIEIRPQLGSLPYLRAHYQTPLGPIEFDLSTKSTIPTGTIRLPKGMVATLVLGKARSPGLKDTIFL